MPSFLAHGSLSVKVEGRLLIVEGAGPWNEESLAESGNIAKPLVQPLLGAPWAVIAIIHGEPVYVPEAAEQLVDIVSEDKRNGRVASALLVNSSSSPRFAKNHIGDIYQRAGETFEFFDDIEEAKRWLLRQLKDVD